MPLFPTVPGPKLRQFGKTSQPLDIKYIDFLGHGLHAFVWKVSINGGIYALKVVRICKKRI